MVKIISTFLINQSMVTNFSMSVITSTKITNEQKQFIEDNSINFSKFVRKQISKLMEKNHD